MNNKAYNKSFMRDIKIIGKSDVSNRKAFLGFPLIPGVVRKTEHGF